MARVLVPNGASYAVLAALRSLTRGGDECEIATQRRRRRWNSSYVRAIHLIPPPSRGEEQYVRALADLAGSRGFDVVMPFSADAVHALSKHRDLFPAGGPGFVVPPPESFLTAHDKGRLAVHCEGLGVDVPRGYRVDAGGEIAGGVDAIRFPVVIKPRRSLGGGRGVRFAGSKAELRRALDDVRRTQAADPLENFEAPLVQEYVPGPVHDACALALEGRVVNLMTQCRLLMTPVAGGVSAVAVTTRERTVAELARRVLESLDWHGPANVEFKYDSREGRYRLLEVNPRFWGTVDLAIRVGMDFPSMIRDFLLGLPVPRDLAYPEGVRYRFLFPRAIMAYAEAFLAVGPGAFGDPVRYERTLYDFDAADWLYELRRVVVAMKAVARSRYRTRTGIPSDYLVTPARAARIARRRS